MRLTTLLMKCALAIVVSGIMAAGPVMADKPSWAGSGKGGKDERAGRGDKKKDEPHDSDVKSRREGHRAAIQSHFDDRHRAVVREYYAEQFRHGRCPPGLTKKRNGCMPPGQAKKWRIGRPLPREVIFHDVPQQVVVKIGPPPAGHRYVRVATDLLMIAIGTGMVVDAINDLGR